MNPITKLSGLVGQNVAAASIIVGGTAIGLGVLGVVIRPADVLSATTDDATQYVSLSEERAQVVDGLKRLIASTHAVIDVRESAGAAELILWTDDRIDPGVVNESELLIISYAPLLQSALAMTATPGPDTEAPFDADLLFSDTLALSWRRQPHVQQAVVATDVTAMRIESVRRDDGTASLSVSLTFAPDNSEEEQAPRAEAMFVVTLPAVSRSR